jgi:hypothetical protein
VLDTVHVFAGLAIGKQITNPLLAFIIGIISHVILDAVPHWDGGSKQAVSDKGQEISRDGKACLTTIKTKVLLIDIAVCFGLGVILSITGILWPGFPSFSSLVSFLLSHVSLITGVFGSLLWDILLLAYLFFPSENLKKLSLFSLHKKLQDGNKPRAIPSLLFQAGLVAIFILLTVSN